MRDSSKIYGLLILVCVLVICNIYLFRLDLKDQNKGFTFAMLDVGQGDGLFIESPTGTQIMFDAGGSRKILGPLSNIMSPFDKSIDAIVITNPDADHIGGVLDILKKYKVNQVFESGTFNDSRTYQNLLAEIERQKIPRILAKRGMRLDIGGGAHIEFLFPDRDVSLWDSNEGSVVAKLAYGNTSVLLTGDSTTKTEKIILNESLKSKLKSTILKVGHHGSRTSTSEEFTQAISPKYAFISSGENNKYGHPHQDTLDTLGEFGVKIFRTDLLGTIIMKSDGQNETFSFVK